MVNIAFSPSLLTTISYQNNALGRVLHMVYPHTFGRMNTMSRFQLWTDFLQRDATSLLASTRQNVSFYYVRLPKFLATYFHCYMSEGVNHLQRPRNYYVDLKAILMHGRILFPCGQMEGLLHKYQDGAV